MEALKYVDQIETIAKENQELQSQIETLEQKTKNSEMKIDIMIITH